MWGVRSAPRHKGVLVAHTFGIKRPATVGI